MVRDLRRYYGWDKDGWPVMFVEPVRKRAIGPVRLQVSFDHAFLLLERAVMFQKIKEMHDLWGMELTRQRFIHVAMFLEDGIQDLLATPPLDMSQFERTIGVATLTTPDGVKHETEIKGV